MKTKPSLIVRKGGELPLTGDALTGLLRAVTAKGRLFRFRARGLSMAPFIRDGDVVTVSPLGNRRPRAGEITAFLHPRTGKVAVHRVVRRKSDLVFLKGDNAFDVDGPLPPDRIFGAVTRIERNGKPVRLGTGPGKAVIALLSRSGWLTPGLSTIHRIVRGGPKGT